MTQETGTNFEARVVLRPRSLDEVLDLAMAYGREHKRDMVRMLLTLALPALAFTAALKLGLELSWQHTWMVVLTLTPILERIAVSYAGRHLFANAPSLRGALAGALRRPFSAVGAALAIPLPLLVVLASGEEEWAIGLGVIVGMFWPFVLAWTIYLSIVVVLEGLPLSRATRRSSMLVSYRYGRAIAFVLMSGAMRILAAIMGDLAIRFLVSFVLQLGEPLDTLFENEGSWASVAGYLAVGPYLAVARLFDYVDARTRLEGWDIQVRFKAVATQRRERVAT